MIHFSTVLINGLLASNSLKGLLDGGKIYVYSGPVPATADAAIDSSCVLLDTITAAAGAGVTFSGTPANGVLSKTASETWSGVVAASGNASFYRYCLGSDNGAAAAGAGNYRVQGSIGVDASFDLVFSTPVLTAGDTKTIDTYQLYLTP